MKQAAPSSRVVAFLDMGTNSIRLLVVRLGARGGYTTLTDQKEQIRLGEGEFGKNHNLQPEAMERAILVGSRFADLARSLDAEHIVAVATSATREARNKRSFLKRFAQASDVDVHVISGREEARLIYLGVVSGIHLDNQAALIIDIGGGSTEVILGNQQSYEFLDSLRLGAIRLASRIATDTLGRVGDKAYEKLCHHIQTTAVRTIQQLRQRKFYVALGSSGTIETLCDLAMRRSQGRPRQKDDRIPASQIRQVIQDLRRMPIEERVKLPGMTRKRGDIIIPGGAILDVLMDQLGMDEIQVSDRALRDGLLIDYLNRHGREEIASLPYRMQSVLRFGRQCQFDEPHARQVARVALALFDTTRNAGLHEQDGEARELLEYAALLHDVGGFLSYANHRRHSYYFIRNAELLGFDDRQVQIIATTALFHKKTYPKKKDPAMAALDKPARKTVRVLATLLRMAESLDRSRSQLIEQAAVEVTTEGQAVLKLRAAGPIDLELWAAAVHAKTFKKTFKHTLEIERVST